MFYALFLDPSLRGFYQRLFFTLFEDQRRQHCCCCLQSVIIAIGEREVWEDKQTIKKGIMFTAKMNCQIANFS